MFRTTDADELKQISVAVGRSQGESEAERLFAGVASARAASSLPPGPDEAAANALLIELHTEVLGLEPRGQS